MNYIITAIGTSDKCHRGFNYFELGNPVGPVSVGILSDPKGTIIKISLTSTFIM